MIECLMVEYLLDFLAILPDNIWWYRPDLDAYLIETINNGTVVWEYNAVKDLYCLAEGVQ